MKYDKQINDLIRKIGADIRNLGVEESKEIRLKRHKHIEDLWLLQTPERGTRNKKMWMEPAE
jgi:hypothetical protein